MSKWWRILFFSCFSLLLSPEKSPEKAPDPAAAELTTQKDSLRVALSNFFGRADLAVAEEVYADGAVGLVKELFTDEFFRLDQFDYQFPADWRRFELRDCVLTCMMTAVRCAHWLPDMRVFSLWYEEVSLILGQSDFGLIFWTVWNANIFRIFLYIFVRPISIDGGNVENSNEMELTIFRV